MKHEQTAKDEFLLGVLTRNSAALRNTLGGAPLGEGFGWTAGELARYVRDTCKNPPEGIDESYVRGAVKRLHTQKKIEPTQGERRGQTVRLWRVP